MACPVEKPRLIFLSDPIQFIISGHVAGGAVFENLP
jgi:hypothetical protein